MPSKTLSCTRGSGRTDKDGWLNYVFPESWTVPDGYKITTVSCTVTKIASRSGTFPIYGSDNGNAVIYISFDISGTDIDDAIKLVFTEEDQITESTRTISVSNYNYTKRNTGITIKGSSVSAATYAGKTKNIRCDSNSTLTLTIDYEQIATPPSAPTNLRFSGNNVAPSTPITLSWDASSANGNTSVTYTVNKNGVALSPTTTSTSYSVTSPSTKSSDTYTVTATGNLVSGSNTSSGVTLTSTYTDPNGVTKVLVNNKSSIYIGTTNKPTLTLNWSGASGGTNNNITGYQVYKDGSAYGSQLGSSTTSLTVSDSGYYTVGVIGTYSNSIPAHSSTSVKATVNIISDPTTPTISSYSTKVGGDTSYSWNATATSNTYSISYNVSYTTNSVTTSYTNVTTNSVAFPVSSKITQGSTYTIKITTTLTAIDGGTKSASFTTNSITYVEPFSFTNIWLYHYDPYITSTQSKMYYAWKSIQLNWNAAAATATSGTSFKYQTFYRLGNNGQWTQLYTPNTNTNYLFDISQIQRGSTIQIFVQASDEYGISVDSDILTISKMALPTLSNLTVSNVDYQKVNFSFTWGLNTSYAVDLMYSCELCYDGVYEKVIDGGNLGHHTSGGTNADIANIDLASGRTAATTSMLYKLYDKVINQKYAKPAGKLRLTLYYNGILECSTVGEIDFSYNFITSFSLNAFSITNQKEYYNPGDKYTYKTTAANWSDAAGAQLGANVEYKVSGNNKEIILSPNTLSYEDTAPQASNDLVLPYTLTGTLSWADGYSISDTKSLSVNIARWSSADIIKVVNVSISNGTVNGSLVLPDNLCSSLKYNNLSKVQYQILYDDNTAATVVSTITNFTNKTIPFSFSTTKTNFNIYGKVTFINTSNNQIVKTSSLYLIRDEGIPLAIRKNYIGINVDKEFTLDKPSALSVYAPVNETTSPVVSIIGNSGNEKIMDMYSGANKVGAIVSRGESGISINGLTTEFETTLSISPDIKTYTIENANITATTTQEIIPSSSTTLAQMKLMGKAMFIGSTQTEGSCTIQALGTIDESASIPIIVIIRG